MYPYSIYSKGLLCRYFEASVFPLLVHRAFGFRGEKLGMLQLGV